MGKKGRGQEQFILALSPAATWGLTEIRQKLIWKAFLNNYWQLLSEENNRSFKTFLFHYQSLFWLDSTPGLHRFLRQPLWEELWLLEPLESFLTSELHTSASKSWYLLFLFLGGRLYLSPYLFCSVPLVVSVVLHLFAIPFMPVVTVNRCLCFITLVQKMHTCMTLLH